MRISLKINGVETKLTLLSSTVIALMSVMQFLTVVVAASIHRVVVCDVILLVCVRECCSIAVQWLTSSCFQTAARVRHSWLVRRCAAAQLSRQNARAPRRLHALCVLATARRDNRSSNQHFHRPAYCQHAALSRPLGRQLGLVLPQRPRCRSAYHPGRADNSQDTKSLCIDW